MRYLTKGPVPEILERNAENWTRSYLSAGKRRAGHWGNAQIKQALRSETAGKCAYCEAKIEHITWSHVEHIAPKSVFPEKSHTWDNLTLACPVCNGNKGDYFSIEAPILNPYEDDPYEHFQWCGGLLFGKPGSLKGRRTVLRLELSRPSLRESREALLKSIDLLLHEWALALTEDKDILARAILQYAQPESEYSECVRNFLTSANFPME